MSKLRSVWSPGCSHARWAAVDHHLHSGLAGTADGSSWRRRMDGHFVLCAHSYRWPPPGLVCMQVVRDSVERPAIAAQQSSLDMEQGGMKSRFEDTLWPPLDLTGFDARSALGPRTTATVCAADRRISDGVGSTWRRKMGSRVFRAYQRHGTQSARGWCAPREGAHACNRQANLPFPD